MASRIRLDCSLLLVLGFVICSVVAQSNLDLYCEAPAPTPVLTPAIQNLTLRQVHVFHRHSDRTPSGFSFPVRYIFNDSWTLDPWLCPVSISQQTTAYGTSEASASDILARVRILDGWNFLPGNCTQGMFTLQGFNMSTRLGQGLRTVYVETFELLPPSLEDALQYMFFYSLAYGDWPSIRESQTLQAAIGGMFPPDTRVSVQQVDIFTADLYADFTQVGNGGPSLVCPNIPSLMSKSLATKPYNEYINHKVKPVGEQVLNALNLTSPWRGMLSSSSAVFDLDDPLAASYCHGKSLPVDLELAEAVFTVVGISGRVQYFSYTPFAIASAAPIWEMLQGSFTDFINANSEPQRTHVEYSDYRYFSPFTDDSEVDFSSLRYLQWCVSDTTLVSLFGSLQQWPVGEWTPYVAHMHFQLWEDTADGSYYVRATYDNDVLELPCTPGHPNVTQELCAFKDFADMVENVLALPEWRMWCALGGEDDLEKAV